MEHIVQENTKWPVEIRDGEGDWYKQMHRTESLRGPLLAFFKNGNIAN